MGIQFFLQYDFLETIKRKSTAVKFKEDGTVLRDGDGKEEGEKGITEDEGLDNAISAMLMHRTGKQTE